MHVAAAEERLMALATRSRTGLGRSPWATQRRTRLGIDWRASDWILIGATVGIAALGLVMVYSTTRTWSDDPYYFLKRQGLAYAARCRGVPRDPAHRLPEVA